MIISFQEVYNIFSPVIGGGLTATISHLLKVRRMNILKKFNDPVADSVKSNIMVEHKVEQTLNDFQADRVFILQFHNGGNFYPSGKSIPKFSLCYEKSILGVSSLREKYQGIPVSIFGKFFNYLAENNVSYVHDFKKGSAEDVEEKGYTRETEAKSSYAAAIKNIESKFMGVIVVQYTKRKRVLTESEVRDIQLLAISLGGSLNQTT